MSFAAGMRAGQEAVSGAIDLYRTAKRNREMREVEDAIQAEQQARAERQFGIQPGQVTTGMTAAQQQQAVMPQVSQTGLTPQQLAAGVGNLGVAGAAPAPGTAVGAGTGLGAQQMAAMVQAPTAPAMAPGGEYTPMTESAVERMRAQRLRGLGYTEEADKALGRAAQMEELAYQQRQDAAKLGLEERRVGALESETEAGVGYTKARTEAANAAARAAGIELDRADDYINLENALIEFRANNPDLSDEDFASTEAFRMASPQAQRVLINEVTGVNASTQDMFANIINRKLEAAGSLEARVDALSQDERVTPGFDYFLTDPDPKTNEIGLYRRNKDGSTEVVVPGMGREELDAVVLQMGSDPGASAKYVVELKREAVTAAANAEQQAIENGLSQQEARTNALKALVQVFENELGGMSEDGNPLLDEKTRKQAIDTLLFGGLRTP